MNEASIIQKKDKIIKEFARLLGTIVAWQDHCNHRRATYGNVAMPVLEQRVWEDAQHLLKLVNKSSSDECSIIKGLVEVCGQYLTQHNIDALDDTGERRCQCDLCKLAREALKLAKGEV